MLQHKEHHSIGELCDEFGVTARALRFYEDEALISPERRGTQRLYTDRDRARLDELGPVEQVEVPVEGAPASTVEGDELAEGPVVLGREPDALGVGDAPHDGRGDGRAEMDVELAEWRSGVDPGSGHVAPGADFGRV